MVIEGPCANCNVSDHPQISPARAVGLNFGFFPIKMKKIKKFPVRMASKKKKKEYWVLREFIGIHDE